MPLLQFHAMFVQPKTGCPIGARIRFGAREVRQAIRSRPPRRAHLGLSVLTTSGTLQATLSAMTLFGATLDSSARLRRRELVALRLPSGWRVKARVRWRLGKRCGVTFLTPVADFARLLRECRAAQSLHATSVPRAKSRARPPMVLGWGRLLHWVKSPARRMSRRHFCRRRPL